MCKRYRILLWILLGGGTFLQGILAEEGTDILEDVFEPMTACPSFCDDQDYFHPNTVCPPKGFCCRIAVNDFECCLNSSLALKEGIKDNHNCAKNPIAEWLADYWKVVLGVCLPVGVVSVVAAVTLCSLQHSRMKRRERQNSRTRSNSAVSGSSYSSMRSCRSATSGPVVVLTAEESTVSTDIHMVNISCQPPPYTNDKPPEYSDISPPPYYSTLEDGLSICHV